MKTLKLKVDGKNLGVYTMDAETETKLRYFTDLQMIPATPATDREKQERGFDSIMAEITAAFTKAFTTEPENDSEHWCEGRR